MNRPTDSIIGRRLAYKVSAIIVLIEVLVLGSLGWWYVSRYAARIDGQLATQARLPGSLMQQGALRFSAVRDPQALGRLIGQDIELALIIQADGRVFEAADEAMLGRPIKLVVPGFEFALDPTVTGDFQANGGDGRQRLAQLSALSNDGRLIGWLYLRIGTGAIEAAKRELAWRYGLTTAASIALTSLVQILLLHHLLNRRIRRTVAVLDRARQGELSARLPGPFSTDEIGLVQQGVNALLAETERRTAERIEAAKALAVSEANYRILVENQSDMVVKVDLDGRFLYVSPSYCRTFGFTAEELIGKPFMPVVHEEDRAATAKAMEALHQPPFTAYMEQRARTPQGWRWFAWQDTLVRDAAGAPTAIIGVGRDITRQVELQSQLRQAQKMDAIGQLAGGVAHDFNNMLTGILGGCQLLANSLPPDSPEHSHIAMISTSATAAAGLTRRLLAFARKAPIQRRVIDLDDVVRSAVELTRHSIDRRIRLEVDGCGPLPVLADASAIQHAVINLILNARDALAGSGHIDVSLRRLPRGHGEVGMPDADLAEIRVVDDGPGIPPEILPRVFEPFFTTKEPGKGTGLGLAAVYATMREHDGTALLDSRPGSTVCRLLMPCSDQPLTPSTEPERQHPLGGQGLVLVAEDEMVLRALAKEVLLSLGYQVLLAEDGRQAVELATGRTGEIRCVLLDLVMPVLSGAECFHRLRELDPGLPIVLCSGYDRESACEDLLAAGANGFVRKPYDVKELAAAIASAVRAQPPGGVSR